MVTKKTKKKTKKLDSKKEKKKVVLTEDEKKELITEGELPKKSIMKKENKQLLWFFIIVAIVFASFLVPFFWVESNKSFEFVGADWIVEKYAEPLGDIYHGRFPVFNNPNLFFNVFLRDDPRENNMPTEGTFDKFKYGGVISTTPSADTCRGELPRAMSDLGSFLGTAVGVGKIESGSTDSDIANQNNIRYARCDTINDRTIIVLDIGEPRIIQDEVNKNCYIIYIEDCSSTAPIEKFMVKTIEDFILA